MHLDKRKGILSKIDHGGAASIQLSKHGVWLNNLVKKVIDLLLSKRRRVSWLAAVEVFCSLQLVSKFRYEFYSISAKVHLHWRKDGRGNLEW
jgi:hypothetical protein